MGLGGIAWIRLGIRRRSNGRMSNLSSKPTFWERPFEGRLFLEEIKSYLAVAAAARAPMARRI